MARVKRSVVARERRRKVFSHTKGQYGRRRNTIRVARQAMERSLQYAYRDRRQRKRQFRSLWIARINAACRASGLKYGELVHRMNEEGVEINRKQLAELATREPSAFRQLIEGLDFSSK